MDKSKDMIKIPRKVLSYVLEELRQIKEELRKVKP